MIASFKENLSLTVTVLENHSKSLILQNYCRRYIYEEK